LNLGKNYDFKLKMGVARGLYSTLALKGLNKSKVYEGTAHFPNMFEKFKFDV